MSRIEIKTKNRRFPIAQNLYGIFFEDINRAGDGGLYPEMIRNTSFEDSILPHGCVDIENGYAMVSPTGWRDEFNHGEGLSRWVRENETAETPVPGWYCENADMRLDTLDTLNENRKASLKVTFSPDGIIYNTGFYGVPQKKNAGYLFYMFAKADERVVLSIETEDDNHVYSQKEIVIDSIEYKKYEVMLSADGDCENARISLRCKMGGVIKLGFCSMMPLETYQGHGLRMDLVEKLRDLHPSFLRFPGGCIVEGFTRDTVMRFKNTIGPVWERAGHLLMWHYHTSNGLGFHEYLQLCEDLQMEPLYVCNCGMTCQARCSLLLEGEELEEIFQDTLNAIEYATGGTDSKWGRVRAQMGHPEPFKMNYIEIGNENFGNDYEKRYVKFYTEIKKQYPNIQIVANTHMEEHGFPLDIADEHYYNTAEYFAENVGFFDHYDRKGPKIFLGELSVVRGFVGRLYAALGEAAFLIGMERNQDIVELSSYAPLLQNMNFKAWYPNLILFNNNKSFAIPSYYVLKMFGRNRGEYVVESKDTADVLYRPVHGMASLFGKPGLQYKEAKWNGNRVEVTHEIMGEIEAFDGKYRIVSANEQQKEEAKRMNGADTDQILVVFGEEEAVTGTFDIDIYVEEDREIIIGVYSSRIPNGEYVFDETNPPKDWNIENVKPFYWKIVNGISTLSEKPDAKPIALTEEYHTPIEKNAFNHFSYYADGRKIWLSINGQLIHEVSVPGFPSMASVVCDTEAQVIIKAVNMSSKADEIEIHIDCDVESNYQAAVLTGDKEDQNSMDCPQKVRDREKILQGAAKTFVYTAPAYSVNVIKLQKNRRG